MDSLYPWAAFEDVAYWRQLDGRIDVSSVAEKLILKISDGWRGNLMGRHSSSILSAPRTIKLDAMEQIEEQTHVRFICQSFFDSADSYG